MKNNMRKRNNLLRIFLPVAVCAIIGMAVWRRVAPMDADGMHRSVVAIEQRWVDAVTIDGRECLFFASARGDTALAGVTTYRDSARHSRLSAGCWIAPGVLVPTCRGRVATVAVRMGHLPAVRGDSAIVRLCRSSLAAELRTLRSQKSETDYYLRSHGVQDEGYQQIAALAVRIGREYDGAVRALRLIDSIAADTSRRHRLGLRRAVGYAALCRQAGGGVRRVPLVKAGTLSGRRALVLQTADRSMPDGAVAVALWPSASRLSGRSIRVAGLPGIGCEGLECDTASPVVVPGSTDRSGCHDIPALLAADGAPAFTAKGRFMGLVSGRSVVRIGSAVPVPAVGRDVPCDGQAVIRHGRTVYRGGASGGRYEGYGTLSVADSVVYAGQWHRGRRTGRGVCHDSLGRRIVGRWQADTLTAGRWTDPTGTYSGQLDRAAIARGHGAFLATGGDLYVGQWRDGQRTGFGFALTHGRHMRVGEWRADRYLGERLEYTADRIYGIDISRFQHDVGRRHYPIDWSRVRISHLGTISRKKIAGRVDYPVSFCYVKSTEGTTLRNRYYAADCRAARSRGIRVGAYHFFSTRTPAAQQALFFLRCSSFCKGDLPPVLDVEPSHAQIRAMGGPEALFRAVRTWMRTVGARTGTRPVLYVSQTFVNRYLPAAPDLKRDYNIWIARYGEYKPDVHLAYWQLCPDGRVSGIRPAVDINVFNGYRAEFDDFLSRECIK